MIERLANLPRKTRFSITVLADLVIIVFSIWAAFSLRLEELIALNGKWWPLFATAPLIIIPVFIRSGLYRAVITQFSLHTVRAIVQATLLGVLLWAVFAWLLGIPGFPRSVPLIGWLVLFVLTFQIRFIMYALFLVRRRRAGARKIALYGTTHESIQLAFMLQNDPVYEPVCFVDEGPNLHGSEIAGLRIYPLAQLAGLIEKHGIKDVLVSITSRDAEARRQVLDSLSAYPVRVRIIPPVTEVVGEPLRIDRFQHVQIEELLGRQKVHPDRSLLERSTTGRRVVVTGAGGSIGAQLCRRILPLEPEVIVLVEQSEHALFEIHRELELLLQASDETPKAANGGGTVIPCLGSVEDADFIADVCKRHSPDIIYHAAAYKHVPMVERNVIAGIRNNVVGTRIAAEAAARFGVRHFVLVSTDKAVRPISVMGASKHIAEMMLQVFAQRHEQTCFCTVRFGNVLGSSGSVMPIFRDQIRRGGAVTVTDPRAERYFMTLEEAAELVIQAGALAASGDIFLLDMGQPVKIVDIAKKMINLSGLQLKDGNAGLDGDIEIAYTGLRAGERLHERLYAGAEPAATTHPKIMRAQEPAPDAEQFAGTLRAIESMLEARDTGGLMKLFAQLMPGFDGAQEGRDAAGGR